MSKESTANRGKIITARNGVFWSSRYISSSVSNALFVSYISFYATNVLGMSIGLIGAILLITKLFDGATDLAAGFIVDNTNTRWGKARPYDWCILLGAISTTLTFAVPHASQMVQAVYIGVMFAISQGVFGTLLGASENVYLLRAFPEEKERNSVFGISLIVGQMVGLAIGTMLPSWVAAAGKSYSGWFRLVFLATVPLSIIGMIRFFVIKEKDVYVKAEDVTKNKVEKVKNSVSLKDSITAIIHNKYIVILTLAIFVIVVAGGLLNTSAAYYFTYVLGDISKMSVLAIASFASLLMVVFFTPLANKFGKVRVLKVSLVIAVIGNVIRWIGGTNLLTMSVGMGLMMFGIMPISAFFPVFLFDIMDYNEWKTGVRVEGGLAVFPSFALKVAGGISISLGAFILQFAGFDGSLAVQSKSAMNTIVFLYNAFPTILLAVMAVLMLMLYDIDKIMPKVKQDLEQRHASETKSEIE